MESTRLTARSALATALAAILAATSAAPPAMAQGRPAPAPTLDGAVGWINADGPVHLEKLRGKVVLLDFWTYCCINCHHLLPELARLEQKYKNQLVVIGVHTAKFDAERDTENIRAKVREYGIKHPVANDGTQAIFDRFGARSWPTIVLIDPTGRLAYKQGGESQSGLEAEIQRLIAQARSRGELDETPVEFPAEMDKPHVGGLLYPGKVIADAASNRLYVSDTGHNRVVVLDLEGRFIEAIGDGKPALLDGDFARASFHRPQGTCLLDGVLYVADTENHAIRAVDLKFKVVKTVAGTGQRAPYVSTSGPGTSTPINSPWDVLPIPGTKTLAIAMAGPHQIWRYDVARGVVGWWSGSGAENIADGPPDRARFAQPSGLATDGAHLFVADSEVSGLRSIDLASDQVQTIAGLGLFKFGDVDGQGAAVRLQHCLGLAYGDGKLYVADTYNNKIKVCDPKTNTISTFLGAVARGSSDNPPRFDEPGGLALAGGTLYVADTNNHAIRAVDLASRAVRTLALEGLKAPARPRIPRFANATLIDVSPSVAAAGREILLDVAIGLPAGYKLSAEAPMIYLAESDPPGAFDPATVTPTGSRIEPPAKDFVLRLPLAKPAAAGSKMTVKLSVSAFICLPNSLCTVKNFAWSVPITFETGVAGPIKLRTAGP